MKYLFFVLFILGFVFISFFGFSKNEKVECQKWQAQAKEFSDFYWADWQVEQCSQYIYN